MRRGLFYSPKSLTVESRSISLKFRLLSVLVASGASVSNRKMSVMAMFCQSAPGRVGVIVFAECFEKKIKTNVQWQATHECRKTCDNRVPLEATPHEINDGAD